MAKSPQAKKPYLASVLPEPANKEAVVCQCEDEADHESQQSPAGGEVLGVAPAGRDDGHQGGRHPAEGGDGEPVSCPATEHDILQDEHRQAQYDEQQRSQGQKASGSLFGQPHLVPGIDCTGAGVEMYFCQLVVYNILKSLHACHPTSYVSV